MSTKNDFPHNIRQPTRKVSNFKGSLWDDMDTVPFEYKNHYEHSLGRMGNYDMWRHKKLWPTAHEDIYHPQGTDANAYGKPEASKPAKKSFLAGFLDHLKDSPYEKEFGKWRNRAGSALGGAFASFSWKTMAKYGAAGTVGYGVGIYSTRKINPNDE
ncbi:hypothetical protein VSS37_02910 [Candidatus Thiothrix sp. Deng01]|uniref:Uncharacterized protein n=1 Tax=Candidatus Thiothrix phosphatis TaxID=3112415 RepID=A0ABU6CSY3_9GAMM|nr:hypothetical protein [Candidatus Thiothrix sp. Deng01]MEB4589920.1 hypothetical protein [Candidatus Thiothrix sp. Deng01]